MTSPGALQAADEAWAHWQAMPMPLHQFEGDLLVLKGSILMYAPWPRPMRCLRVRPR